MNILTIDTSTTAEIITVAKSNQYSNMSKDVEVSHSKTIISSIDQALNNIDLNIKDINLIGVGVGPGSFTGIRIAVSTARMFAQILNTPLVSIPTPLIFATSIEANVDDYILIAFDAKKKRVFGALYKVTANTLQPEEIVKPGDYFIDDLLKMVNKDAFVHMYGDGITKYQHEIENISIKYKNYLEFLPEAKIVSNLTKSIYENNSEKFKDINNIKPDYTRKSDAEVAKLLREKNLNQ